MALYLGSNEVSQKVLLLSGNKSDIEVGDLCYSLRTEKEGWLLCDGTSYSTTDYPDLFAVIGYTFGGSENNFNVPNYKGKFLQMINDSQTLGQNIEAGLPNIDMSASFYLIEAHGRFIGLSNNTGSVYGEDAGAIENANGGGDVGSNAPRKIHINGNLNSYNTIYGNSNTVQPPASIVNYFIKY